MISALPRKKTKLTKTPVSSYTTINRQWIVLQDKLGTSSKTMGKPKNGDPLKVKNLFIHSHTLRRAEVLNDKNVTTQSIPQKYPLLKKSSYIWVIRIWLYCKIIFIHVQAKLEFELTMQRPSLKNEFDEELILWSKAVTSYCKKTCKNQQPYKN